MMEYKNPRKSTKRGKNLWFYMSFPSIIVLCILLVMNRANIVEEEAQSPLVPPNEMQMYSHTHAPPRKSIWSGDDGVSIVVLADWSLIACMLLQGLLSGICCFGKLVRLTSERTSAVMRALLEAAEPICVFVLMRFMKSEPLLCFINAAIAVYVLAFLRVVIPLYDFNIPAVFAISAIHLSWEEGEDLGEGNFRVYIVIIAIFFFISKAFRISRGEEKNEPQSLYQWNKTGLINLESGKADSSIQLRRYLWFAISLISGFVVGVLIILYPLKENDPVQIVVLKGGFFFLGYILFALLIFLIGRFGPLIRFRSDKVAAPLKGLFDLFGAFSAVAITMSTKNPGSLVCFLYATVAAYCMACLQVAIPLYDFNLPSVFATSALHLAWKDAKSLTDESWRLYLVGYIVLLFVLKAIVRIFCDCKKKPKTVIVEEALDQSRQEVRDRLESLSQARAEFNKLITLPEHEALLTSVNVEMDKFGSELQNWGSTFQHHQEDIV